MIKSTPADQTEEDMGILRKAMAWRVKYRVCQKKPKRYIPPVLLCIHPSNRGGVYAGGETVKKLGEYLLQVAFQREEADHAGVCVQDVPPAHRSGGSVKAIPYAEWNRKACAGSALLQTCFVSEEPHLGTLSHSHLLLVLLCWMTKAKWNLKDSKGNALFCTPTGELDIDAVALFDNAREMITCIKEGMLMEELGWQINIEEPTACTLISIALNKGHECALKNTELTAVAVLSGEITRRANMELAGRVQFECVKAAVRLELDVIVDEPEFVELFEFVISLGGAKNTYIPGLILFAERYVDQKKRQLRLQAFGEINKMPAECPRTKIATLKRAYRQDPSHGFCPVPESRIVQSTLVEMRSLEDLLQFFHVTMSTAVAGLGDLHARIAFLANVDVSAVGAYVASPKAKIREHILSATAKYYFQLKPALMPVLEARLLWIQFKKIPDQATVDKPAVLMPKMLSFDEQSGRVSDKQDERVDKVIPPKKPYVVPWRQWFGGKAFREMGLKQAEMSAAKQILDLLHSKARVIDMPIEVLFDPIRRIYKVLATRAMPAGTLLLPPCVPKQATLLETSEHPYRAQILVKRREHTTRYPLSRGQTTFSPLDQHRM